MKKRIIFSQRLRKERKRLPLWFIVYHMISFSVFQVFLLGRLDLLFTVIFPLAWLALYIYPTKRGKGGKNGS